MSAKSDDIRVNWKINDAKRDEGLTTPDEIKRFDDIAYGPDKDWQWLDVYRLKSDEGIKLPVIVSVHGGAWVYGDKELYQFYCMNLALRGFAVVNFTYRLAPEFKFPAALEDTNSVISWIIEHADEYDLDADNIFLVGDSAGGNLAALYANFCTNPEYAKKFDFTAPEGFKPKAVAFNCGKFTFKNKNQVDDVDDPELLSDFMPHGGSEEDLDMMEVLDYVTENFPTAYIMTAYNDFLKYQAPLLAGKLMEKQVPYTLAVYGDAKDGLYHVFHVNIKTVAAEKCNDDECAFFAKNL